ncbi:MAG: dTDP-glucose 4,6-dehydratase, partial [Actinobacteria bacterium]|nr:dTDP-glucose 4,6-dehydratase [Actinomycetota bacterium]
DRRYSIDCSKIEKEFGWVPEYNFEEALEKTVYWYINNEEWWRPLKERIVKK